MKTFRKMSYYGGYWARFRRTERKEKQNSYSYYSKRPITCARAAWMMDKEQILSKRYDTRNFYGKKIKI